MELQPDGSALFAEAEEEIERLEALLVPSADADGGGERASADVAIGAAAAAAASAGRPHAAQMLEAAAGRGAWVTADGGLPKRRSQSKGGGRVVTTCGARSLPAPTSPLCALPG